MQFAFQYKSRKFVCTITSNVTVKTTRTPIPFLPLLNKLLNIGVTDKLSFEEKRKTRAFNMVALLGVNSSLIFFCINLFHGIYVLCIFNLFSALAAFGVIHFHYRENYRSGYIVMTSILSLVFSGSAVLFKNNVEFYLLLIVTSTVTLVRSRKVAFIIGFINAMLFLGVYMFKHLVTYDVVSETRRDINLSLWVAFFLMLLYFLKRQNYNYQSNVEEKNNLLELQQQQLIEQKYQLEDSNNKLQILNKTKEKLFSIVAHDIRTPIAGLKTSLELFNQNTITKEEFTELSTELSIQVNQLQNNLDNLLYWSRSQMNGIEAKKATVSLKPIVLDTLNLLQQNLSSKNIKIDFAVTESFNVYADANHILLILRNLISNAIKYSYPNGRIVLSAKHEQPFILFSVQDFGTGINAAKLDSLFQQGEITSQYGTQNEKGTGLGLMLCKEFVEKNGGMVWGESQEKKGSIFTFSIPAA